MRQRVRIVASGTWQGAGAPATAGETLSLAGDRGIIEYVPGDLTIEGRPRMYGALVVGGKVTQTSEVSGQLEIWYNYGLRSGIVQGMPLVYVAPGTWVEKY